MTSAKRGFTLIELLISVVLMMIIMASVTLIFMRTTETVMNTEARTKVYTEARYALDTFENDLMGCLSFSGGAQRFIMENGKSNSGAVPTYGVTGNHVGNAADRVVFRTTTTVADKLQTVEVEYALIPGDKTVSGASGSLPFSGTLDAGDPARKETLGGAPAGGRPLGTLVRRVRAPNPANPSVYDQPAKDKANTDVPDQELAHFIISFNLEYYSNQGVFSQLEPSYFTSAYDQGSEGGAGSTSWGPLGNGAGANDLGGAADTPMRVPFIRVTLVIVEDAARRSERMIQKTMWVPMG